MPGFGLKPSESTLMDMSFSLYGFSSLSPFYFLVHEQALSLCGEAADSFSEYKCYSRTWNIAPEIITCTSDLSVDSITRVGLLSKELSFLDMLENSTFLAISGMDDLMFWVPI